MIDKVRTSCNVQSIVCFLLPVLVAGFVAKHLALFDQSHEASLFGTKRTQTNQRIMEVSQQVGKGGLPTYKITHASGATAEVYTHGCTVTSYKTAKGKELLFVSGKSAFDGSTPIRGGIPLVFPIFGSGWGEYSDLPSHGFARRSTWKFSSHDNTSVVFTLSTGDISPEFARVFPFSFTLQYEIVLDASGFSTKLVVNNNGDKDFDVQALLHTYYDVNAIGSVKIEGLQGVSCLDKLTDGTDLVTSDAPELGIDQEVDRIYTNVTRPVVVKGIADSTASGTNGKEATIQVSVATSEGVAPDCVVWNPWVAKAARMGDFGDEEYANMLCVEPGVVYCGTCSIGMYMLSLYLPVVAAGTAFASRLWPMLDACDHTVVLILRMSRLFHSRTAFITILPRHHHSIGTNQPRLPVVHRFHCSKR
eukprot:m.236942 g.236942  ORF g.236942 m.236942 type:complete len:419 (-) comp19361_c0_seq1:229-1485(-)